MILTTMCSVLPVSAGTYYWDADGVVSGNNVGGTGLGGSGDWDTTSPLWWNLTNDVAWPNSLTFSDTAIFSGTAGSITLGAPINAGSLVFKTDGYALSGDVLTLGGPALVNVGVYTSSTIGSQIAGTSGLTKTGDGTLILTNNSNSFSGDLVINGGALVVTAPGQLGTGTSVISVNGQSNTGNPGYSGGSLVLQGGIAGMTVARDISVAGRGPGAANASGSLISIGNNTITGDVTFTSSATESRSISAMGNLTLAGNVLIGGAGQATNFYGNGNWIVSGQVTGYDAAGQDRIIKTGNIVSTTLWLQNSANNFAQPLRLDSGTVRVTTPGALGTSVSNLGVDFNSGTLEVRTEISDYTAHNTYVRGVTGNIFVDHDLGSTSLNKTISFGALNISANATISMLGRNGYNLTVGNGGVTNWPTGGTMNFSNSGSNGTLFINTTISHVDTTVRNLTYTASGEIVQMGDLFQTSAFATSIIKNNTGMLTLQGSNPSTMTGTTTINAGTITVSSLTQLPTDALLLGNLTTSSGAINYIGAGETSGKAIVLNTTSANAYINANGTGALTLNGTITAPIAGNKSLVLGGTSTADNEIQSAIPNSTNLSLLKIGTGTWVLSGANTFTGGTGVTVSGGTLKIKDTFAGSSRDVVLDANALVFNTDTFSQMAGGTLQYVGDSGATSTETLGALTATTGLGTIQALPTGGGSAALTFASLGTRATGATVNILSGGAVSITGTSGFLNAGYFYNGADFAYSTGGVIGAPVYDTSAGFVTAGAALTAASHNFVAANTNTGALSVSSLKIAAGATVNQTGLLTINAGSGTPGGILVDGGSSAITGTGVTTGGGGDLVVQVNQATAVLTMTAPITSTTTGGLTKSGLGTLILQGAQSYTGTTTINQGTISLDMNSRLGGTLASNNNGLTIRQDGVLDLNDNTIGVGAFNGAGLVRNSGASRAFFTIGNNNQNGYFTGLITGDVTLNKVGSGTAMSLTGLNTFTGAMILSGGTLIVNNLANIGSPSSIGTGDATDDSTNAASLYFQGGTLLYQGANSVIYQNTQTPSVSIDRLFTLAGNGTIDSTGTYGAPTLSAVGNNAALMFNNPGDIRFDGTGARTLTLQGSSTGDNYFAPRLGNNPGDPSPTTTGLLSLTKSGTGLWILGNAGNDYGGTTSINGGALQAIDGTTLPTGSNLFLNGGVFQSSGTGANRFDRTLGTGADQFRFAAAGNGGFSSGTAEFVVDWSGLGTPTWGSTTNFLGAGALILNHATSLSDVEVMGTFNVAAGVAATPTITTSNNSANVTITSGSTAGLTVGQAITGPGIQAGTYIASITGATTFTLNQNTAATGAGTGAATITAGGWRQIQVDDNTTTNLDFATVSGVIGGDGGLGKIGSAPLILGNANTYSGNTVIRQEAVFATSIGAAGATSSSFGTNVGGGFLELGNPGTTTTVNLMYVGSGETTTRSIYLGGTTGTRRIDSSGSGALILTSLLNSTALSVNTTGGAKTLELRGTNVDLNTVTSILTDNGGALTVTKTDGGTWALAPSGGPNTFTGNINISSGNLGLTADGIGAAGNVIISNAGMFAYGGTLNTTKPITLANNSTAIFSGSNDIIFATLQKQAGANDQTISNNIDAGKTLTIGNFLNLETATATRTMFFRGTGATTVTGAIRNNSATSLTRIDIRMADSAVFTLAGNNAADSLGFTGGILLGQGTLVVANVGGLGPAANNVILDGGTFTSTVDLTGANKILNRIQLQGDQVTVVGSQNIEFGAAIAMDQNGSRFLLNNLYAGKSLLISGQVNLTNDANARTLTIRGSGVTTITGVVANGSTGLGTLAFSGLGSLILNSTATATGSLTVNRNLIVLSGPNGSWNAGTVTVNASGTLQLDNSGAGNNNNNRLNAAGAFVGNGGTLDIIGATGGTTVTTGNLALNNVQTYVTTSGGPVTVNFASMTMPNQGSSLNLLGVSGLGTTNKVFIGGTLPTGAVFNNIMPRVFIGDDFSTYVGGTTGVAAFSAYNTGNDLNAAAATDTLALTASSSITIGRTVNAIKLNGSGLVVGGNTGTTLTLAGAAILNIGGNNSINVPILAMGANTGFFQVKNGTTLTVNSAITGTAGLSKAITGDMILNSQNFYTGSTNLLNGTMTLAGGLNTLFQNQIFNINNGATLDLNGNTQFTERLTDPGILPDSGGVITSNAGFGTFVTNMNAGSTTVMTQFVGNVNLVRLGGNTLTFGSAQSYVGSTTLMGGTLTLQDDATILNTSVIDINAANLTLNNNGSLQTANYNRIGDTIPINLRDGTLQFTGKVSDASTETFGALTSAQGANTITVANGGTGTAGALTSADILFASLTRNAGTTLNFTGTSLGLIGNNVRVNFATAPTTYLGGALGAWAIANNNDYAAYNSANGVGTVGNGGYVGYVSTFGTGNITNLGTAVSNVGTVSSGAMTTTLSDATTGMLRINGVYTNNIAFNSNSNVLNLELGGILRPSNAFSTSFGTTSVRGVLTAGGTETTGVRDLVVYTNATTNPTFGGGTTNPTTTTLIMSSTQGLAPGMTLTGANIAAGTTIVSIDSFTQVTLSQPTTNAAQLTNQTYTAGSFVTGSTTNTSNLVSMNSTVGIFPGMTITGTGIPAGSYVTSVENGTQVRISQNATADANGTLTFTLGTSNVIINSVIADNGFGNSVKFVKSGPGIVNLSANNTYSGGTAVDQGTLNLIGSGIVVPAGGLLLGGATVVMNTNSGQIDPSNTVTLRRSSTLTLVGNNVLNALAFDNNGGTTNPIVTIGAGNTLTLTDATPVTVLNSNALTVPTISLGALALGSGTKTFDIQGPTAAGQLYSIISPSLNVTSVITGEGASINKVGTGILQFSGQNTFSGGVTLNEGGILLTVSSTTAGVNQGLTSGPLGTGMLTAAAGTTLLVDGSRTLSNDITYTGSPMFDSTANSAWTLTLNGNITLPTGAVTIRVNNPFLTVSMLGNIPNIASVTNITKTGLGTLNFNSTGYTGPFNAGQLGNPTSLSIFNDGDGTGTPNSIALGALNFDAGVVPTITIGRAGQTFPYTAAANKFIVPSSVNSITGGLVVINNNGYGLVVQNNATLVGSPAFSVATATNSNVTQGLYLNGVLSGTGFTKVAAGTMVLGNSGNNFTGNIVINQGVVSIGAAGALGNAANLVVLSPTTGTSTLRVTSDVTTSNSIQLSNTANTRAIEVTVGSILQLDSAFNLNSGAGNTASLAKNDNGTLAINANNSGWSGALAINAGAVRALTNNALGTGTITVAPASGAALQLAGGVTITNPFTMLVTSTGINNGGIIESVVGNNTYSGAITQTSGAAATYGARSGAVLNLTGTYSSAGANSITFAGAGNINVSSALNNGATFNKVGSGTLTMTGASTLAAATTLNFSAGTTVFQGAGAVGANGTGAITVDVGATLTINNTGGNVNNRMGSTRPITFRGGFFNLIGNASTATTETFAVSTFSRGYSVISVDGTGAGANLVFTGSSNSPAPAQNAAGGSGASILFRGTNLGSAAGAGVATIRNTGATNGFIFNGQNGAINTSTKGIMPYALIDTSLTGNGFSFATGDPGGTTNAGTIQNIRPLSASEYGAANAVLVNINALLTASTTVSATTASSSLAPNSLTFDGTTNANIDFTLNSGLLFNLSSGGILVRTGANVTMNGGGVLAQTSGFSPLNIWTLGDLTINTVMYGGQGVSSGNLSMVKAGAGTLTITTPTSNLPGLAGMSANSLSGQWVVNQGVLVLNGGKNTFQANNYLALNGGSVDLNGTSQQILALLTDTGVANAGGTIFSSTGTGNLVINQDNAQRLFSGTITGNVTLTRSGQSNFILYSPQTYVGATVINGGATFLRDEAALVNTPSIELSYATLNIDNSGGTIDLTNRVNDVAPITLRGGTLAMLGRAQTDSTESVGVVTLAQSNSFINSTTGGTGINSSVLNLAGLNRTVGGGTVNFGAGTASGTIGSTARITIQAINGVATATVGGGLTNGIIGGWAITNTENFASYIPGLGVGALGQTGFAQYSPIPLSALAGPTDNIRVNYTGLSTIADDTTINSVKFDNIVLGGVNLAVGKTLTIGSGGFLNFTSTPWSFGTVLNQGTLTSGGPELFIYTQGNGTPTINSVIAGSGMSVIKSGASTLVLAGTNTYDGGTFINQGTTNVAATGNIPLAANPANGLVVSGGTINFNAPGAVASSNYITVNGNGVVNLYGANTVAGVVMNNNGGSANPSLFTYVNTSTIGALTDGGYGVLTIGSGGITATSSNVGTTSNIFGRVDFGPSANTINVGTIDVNGVTDVAPLQSGLALQGVVGSSGGITKTGAGVLGLNAQMVFTGALNVTQGSVRIGVTNGGSRFSTLNLGAGTALNIATLSTTLGGLSGSGTVYNSGGNPSVTASTLTVGFNNQDTTFSGKFSRFNDGIVNPVFLQKVGTGTLSFTGTQDLADASSGTVTVSGGTLSFTGGGRWFVSQVAPLVALNQTFAVSPGGTLLLDNSADNQNSRLGLGGPAGNGVAPVAGTLAMNGGTFRILGNSAAPTLEWISTGNFAGGGGRIELGADSAQALRLAFTSIANRGTSGSLVITGINGSAIGTVGQAVLTSANAPNQTSGSGAAAIRPDIIVDANINGPGTGFLVLDATNSTYRALATSQTNPTATAWTSAINGGLYASQFVNVAVPTANSITTGANIAAGPTTTTLNSTQFVGGTANEPGFGMYYRTGAIQTLTVTSGGVLVRADVDSNGANVPTTVNINVGAMAAGTNPYFHVLGDTTLNINSQVYYGGGAGSDYFGFLKTGDGVLNFNARYFSRFYTGNVLTVNGGTLNLNSGYENTFPILPNYTSTSGVTSINGTPVSINNAGSVLDLKGMNQFVGGLSSINTLPGYGGTVRTTGGSATLSSNGGGTFAGVLADGDASSKLSFVRAGNNTTLFTSKNTYTGSTTIRGGTLQLRDSGAIAFSSAINIYYGTLSIDNSGLNALDDPNPTRVSATAPVTMQGGTITLTAGGSINSSASLGNVSFLGGANTITPTFNANQGSAATLTLANLDLISLAGSSGTLNVAAAIGQFGIGQSQLFIAQINGSTPVANSFLGPNVIVNGGDYAAYSPTFGLGAMQTGTTSNFANYAAALVSGANTPTAINANTAALVISANTTTGSMRFGVNANIGITFTAGTEVLNLAIGGLLSGNNGNTVDIGTSALRGVLTTGGTATSGTTDLVTYQNQNTTTINSIIADNGAGANTRLVKSGAGTLRVTAANTYTGGTIVNQGTLNLQSTTAGTIVIPAAGGLTINNATVTQTTNNQQIDPAARVSINGGGVLNLTTGNNTLAGLSFNNSGSSSVPSMNIGANTLTLTANDAITVVSDNFGLIPIISNLGNSSTAPTAGSGTLSLTGSAPVINVGGSAPIGLTIASLLSAGTNTITKTGTGTLALTSGSSIIAGGFNLDQGTIIIGSTGGTAAALNNPLGIGPLRIGNGGEAGITSLSGFVTIFSNEIAINGNLTIGGNFSTHSLRFTNAVNFDSGSRTISITSPSVSLTILNGSVTTTATAGTDFLVKAGLGTLILGQAPAAGWNGAGVWIKEGLLKTLASNATPVAGSGAAIPADTPLKLSAGGGFDTAGFDQTIAGLSDGATGSGGFITNSDSANVTLTLNSNNNSTFSGALTDTATGTTNRLAFTKQGSGALTLGGISSYSGATNVNAGKLILNGTIAATVAGGTTFNVAAGATLGGTGTIGTTLTGVVTNVTVAGNAALDFRDNVIDNLQILAPTSATANNLTLGSATNKVTLYFDLGSNGSVPAVDRIDVTNRLKIFDTVDPIDALVVINPLSLQIQPSQATAADPDRSLKLLTYSGLDTSAGGGGIFGFASGLATEQYMGNNYAIVQTLTAVELQFWKIDDPANAYWRGGTADDVNSWNSFKDRTSDTNFFTTATGNVNTLQVPGPTTNVFFANSGYSAANLATELDASFTINSLNFSSSTGTDPVSIAPGSSASNLLTLVGSTANSNIDGRGIYVASGTQSAISITTNIALDADQFWQNDGSGDLLIAGSEVTGALKQLSVTGTGHTTISAALRMTGTTDALAFTKTDGGMLTLSGANDYTVPTNITGGILEITGAGTLGNGDGTVTIADAGSLVMNQSGSTTISNRIKSSDVYTTGGQFVQSGTGTTILTNDNTQFFGSATVSRGTLVSAGGSAGPLQNATSIIVGGAGNTATLVATGSVHGMTIQNQGILSPGASATGNHEVVGTLAGTNVTLAAGSTFTFQFLGGLRAYDSGTMGDDPSGTVNADDAAYQRANGAGTAWDLLTATKLDLSGASSSNRVNLQVISMSDPSTPGSNSGFGGALPLDPDAQLGTPATLHWLFADTTTGVTLNGSAITGDINDYFNIDSSLVTSSGNTPVLGSFYISLVGNELYLNYSAVPEPGSLLLMGIAGFGFGGLGWKKRRRKAAEAKRSTA